MLELKTIETDRYEEMEDGVHVKHVGMIKPQEAFDQLKAHLEKVGLLPDEYFNSNDWKWRGEKELPDYIRASCDVNWGGCEGIYLDISLLHRENNESGSIVRVSENAYDNLQLTQQEKTLISKALDTMGDRIADTEGYSAGEEYWSLAEKFEPVSKEETNEFLKGKDSAFVEVYKLVKEARFSNPVNPKALNDIESKYGKDLYKEALDVVLKEQHAKVFIQMQNAFKDLPLDEKIAGAEHRNGNLKQDIHTKENER